MNLFLSTFGILFQALAAVLATSQVSLAGETDLVKSIAKVSCPELSGSYVCGRVCDSGKDSGNDRHGRCISWSAKNLFGAVHGDLSRVNGRELGFRIRQNSNQSSSNRRTVYSFDDSQKLVDFQTFAKIPWGSNEVISTCIHDRAFILQMVTDDFIHTGLQRLRTKRLTTQSFRKDSKGRLHVSRDSAIQSIDAPGLKVESTRMICSPKKWTQQGD